MTGWMKMAAKAIFCARVVNAGFVGVCLAAAMGAPPGPVMLVSAGLYAVLVWIG
ncbi:MAG: hypothetical protein QNJ44_22060 [Rhodobacter sp.]|nr:hypothetical protein [Rhodobacter sp.]